MSAIKQRNNRRHDNSLFALFLLDYFQNTHTREETEITRQEAEGNSSIEDFATSLLSLSSMTKSNNDHRNIFSERSEREREIVHK